MRILYVLPSLRHGSALRQVEMLVRGLRDGNAAEIVTWDDPASVDWDDQSLTILPQPRACDARPGIHLRQVLQDAQPDVIHLFRPWELPPSAWLSLCSLRTPCVATGSWPNEQLSIWQRAWLRRCDHWFLLADDPRLRIQLGIRANRWSLQPAAVPSVTSVSQDRATVLTELGLTDDAQFVLTVGSLSPRKGIKEAIWTLDILRYLFPHLHLVVVGVGPMHQRLEQFATDLRLRPYVHFLDERPDVANLMTVADVFWQPGLADDVPQAMLEALALGRPVVATRTPGTVALLRHDQDALLAPAGDKPALARQSKLLLEDATLRERIGAGGLALARRCPPAGLVHFCLAKYKELLGARGHVPATTVAA